MGQARIPMIQVPRMAMLRWIALGCAALLALPRVSPADASSPAEPKAEPLGAPSMAQVVFNSHGSRLNGLIYHAAGEGPHPVALFLHGFPGNEKNLDLAQAVRRAGWDAIYFNYRGSWGSGGTFSFANSLEDVATALAWIRTPENAAEHHFDPNRVAVIGHSFGGWLALQSAGRQAPHVCVAVMAAWNVGWLAQHQEEKPADWAALMADFRDVTDPAGGPLRTDAEALLREVTGAPAEWDYLSQAPALVDHPLLMVAATQDTADAGPAMHDQLAAAVRAAGGAMVRSVTLKDDHAFSASRLDLAELMAKWLNEDCATNQEVNLQGD